jgi:hypothetical protein
MSAQEPADTKASGIKAVRSGIHAVTLEIGHAAGRLTLDPQQALASLDSAIGLLKASRDLFATVTELEP